MPRALRWLLDDVGLKLLAFVLAVSTWALVRDTQLKATEEVPDVTVEIESYPPDARILPGGTRLTKLKLVGTTGTVRRARAQLDAAGRKIKLRVHDLKDGAELNTHFSNVDDFSFPFEGKQVVASIEPPVEVKWTRIATLELDAADVAKPVVLTGPGYFETAPGFPTFDTPKFTVTGPVALIERLKDHVETLVPDPVDAQGWLKLNPDLTTLHPWSEGFAQWRAAEPGIRSEALVTIVPATASGKLKVRETKAESVKADVAILYPPGVLPSAYDAFDVKMLDTGYDARTRKLEISVKGESALAADRKSLKPEWMLVVMLPPPPGDGAPDLDNATADVQLVSRDDGPPIPDAKSRVRLVGPTKVFVSIARKKP